jgi:hypothetical protein
MPISVPPGIQKPFITPQKNRSPPVLSKIVKIKKNSFLQNSIFEIWEKKTKNSFPGLSIGF